MASSSGAEARIRYLIGRSGYRGTPATITGTSRWISSYAKVIGRRNLDDTWTVVEPRSSMTTNRHIRALMRVLANAGYGIETVPYHTSL